ncbi:MAG: hypothetical protein F4Y78_02045 [Candidatus Dadabacteria bacterium]|nr:hypothetical protein [Candidatus Dadabacteria bacterium]MYA47665.1 hypothetical protein [Candidatus Dadabacteria bacterium]MYG83546.1 hypothetical protein [Candidatus Dadabacteria bacterium]MYK49765.1 hypothetical protein [Candidatus Dadabacteria bacterium]
MERPRQTDEFWDWLVKRPVTDTPRGDFIEDTLALVRADIDPRDRLHRLVNNPKAEAVLKRLERLYKNSKK